MANQDAAILWSSVGLTVMFLVALVPAWIGAYKNHPDLTIWGTKKRK